MKAVLLFVGLQIVCSLGFLLPESDKCPEVEVDPNADAKTECRPCFDCTRVNKWCCPNKCGTTSCSNVRKHCVQDGRSYYHRDFMDYPNNRKADDCAICWCFNGEKQCRKYSCKGRPPLPGDDD